MSEGPDAWAELQTLFDLIDRTPEPEQQRVLDAACTDAEMRARVLRMVRGANQDRDSSTGLAGRVVGGSTDNSDMLYFLARAYLATGRYRDAETTARELLALLTDKVSAQERSLGTAHLVLAEALAAPAPRWRGTASCGCSRRDHEPERLHPLRPRVEP